MRERIKSTLSYLQLYIDAYFLFRRWGRVGCPGQQDLQPYGGNLEIAKGGYEKKVREKSVEGDYRILEKYYGFDADQKNVEKLVKLKEQKDKESSKQNQKIKELMALIFDMKLINNQMREIGYDAKRLPLGNLVASTINKGFDVLNKISQELNKKTPNVTTLQTLTSEFYSQIPHDFGFQKAPIINTAQIVNAQIYVPVFFNSNFQLYLQQMVIHLLQLHILYLIGIVFSTVPIEYVLNRLVKQRCVKFIKTSCNGFKLKTNKNAIKSPIYTKIYLKKWSEA